MDSRKFLIGLCAFLAVALLLLLLFTLGTGSHKKGASAEAALRGKAGGVADGVSSELLGRGLMGSVMDSLAQGSSLPGDGRSDGKTAGGTPGSGEPPAAGEGTGGDDAASDEEKKRLQLIEMKDREAGKKKLYYGYKTSGSKTGSIPTSGRASTPYSKPSEEQVLSTFESFIQKLKRSARASMRERSGSDGSRGSGQKEFADDPISPVLSVGPLDGPKTPTLQLLEKINQDSAHSVQMSNDPGMEDGSRDHFGKKFDGNLKTFNVIPIDEAAGAFGRKEIRASQDSMDVDNRPADLKR
ncbi:MAG: hypothetical protein WC728_12525 [Elusimicrobiota bacterium]